MGEVAVKGREVRGVVEGDDSTGESRDVAGFTLFLEITQVLAVR